MATPIVPWIGGKRRLAKSIKGRMIVSVNDIPAMRQAFAGLEMERLEINYTVCGAGRSKGTAGELLIRNW